MALFIAHGQTMSALSALSPISPTSSVSSMQDIRYNLTGSPEDIEMNFVVTDVSRHITSLATQNAYTQSVDAG